MPAQRTGDGTAKFTAENAAIAKDVFGVINPVLQERIGQGSGGAVFTPLPGKSTNEIAYWRLEIYNWAGLGKRRGNFNEVHDRLVSSSLDTGHDYEATLPLKTQIQTSPDPGSGGGSFSSVNIYDTLIVAADSTSNAQLFKETAAHTLAAITYAFNIGATIYNIRGVGKIAIASQAPQLVVWGAIAAEVLSDAAGTLYGSITNATQVDGMIQTPLPGQPIVMISGGAVKTLQYTSALGDVPTTQQENVGRGGYIVGLTNIAGGVARVLAVLPKRTDDPTVNVLISRKPGYLVTWNMRGGDPAPVEQVPLKYVIHCTPYLDGVMISDEDSSVFYSGRMVRDTQHFAERSLSSDRQLKVCGYIPNGKEILAKVQEIAANGGTGATVEWLERYNFDTNRWTVASGRTTLSTTGRLGYSPVAGFPVSESTRVAYSYRDGAWASNFLPPYGQSTYEYRKTSGVSVAGHEFEETGTATPPVFRLPSPLTYNPSVIDAMYFGGELQDGETARITAGGMQHTFQAPTSGPITDVNRIREFPNNQSRFQFLEVEEYLTRPNGSTYQTPQGLPIVLEGHTYLQKTKPRKFFWWK